jgi:hypothetical protein
MQKTVGPGDVAVAKRLDFFVKEPSIRCCRPGSRALLSIAAHAQGLLDVFQQRGLGGR